MGYGQSFSMIYIYTLYFIYFFLEKDIFHTSNIGIYRGTNLINQGWNKLCSVDFEIDNYVLF